MWARDHRSELGERRCRCKVDPSAVEPRDMPRRLRPLRQWSQLVSAKHSQLVSKSSYPINLRSVLSSKQGAVLQAVTVVVNSWPRNV